MDHIDDQDSIIVMPRRDEIGEIEIEALINGVRKIIREHARTYDFSDVFSDSSHEYYDDYDCLYRMYIAKKNEVESLKLKLANILDTPIIK